MLELEHIHKSQPLYAQIKQILQHRIEERDYLPGDLIPSEFKLTEEFGVSRITIRQALSQLESEGLVERIQGKGTRVAYPHKIEEHLNKIHTFSEEMEKHGMEVGTKYSHIEWIRADETLANIFKCEAGEYLYKLSRVCTGDSIPLVYSISYFSNIQKMPLDDREYNKNIYDVLSNFVCERPLRSEESFSAVNATKDIADLLGVDKGAAVLARKRKVIDNRNRTLVYVQAYYPGERYLYKIQLKD